MASTVQAVETGRSEPARALKVCPVCDETTPAQRDTCHRCWSDLREVPVLSGVGAAERLAADQAAARAAARMRRLRRFAVAGALLIVALGFIYLQYVRDTSPPPLPASAARSGDVTDEWWPAGGGNAGATRVTAAAPPLDGEVTWRRSFGAAIVATIVVGPQTVYVPLADARLVALAVEDGRELWSAAVPGQLDSAPTLAAGRLYLGLRDGRAAALDAKTGVEIWSRAMGSPIATAPVVADGIMWVLSKTQVMAFDAEDGTPLWQRDIESTWNPVGPVVTDDRVIVSTGQEVLVFDRENGEQTYHYVLQQVLHLAAEDGTVTALSPTRMLSIEADASRPWWERARHWWGLFDLWGMAPSLPSPPRNWLLPAPGSLLAPAMDGERLFLATADGEVRSYGQRSGELLWQRTGDAPVISAPLLTASGLLIVEHGSLVLLDAATGDELRRSAVAGLRPRDVTVTARRMFVVTERNELVAIR